MGLERASIINEVVRMAYEVPSGSSPYAATGGVWTLLQLNTAINPNSYSWVSLVANKITLLPGNYFIYASQPFYTSNQCKIRLWNNTDGLLAINGTSHYSSGVYQGEIHTNLCDNISISAIKEFQLEYYIASAGSNSLGNPVSSGINELYTEINIWKLK